MSRLPLTMRFPWLYPVRVRQRRLFRWLRWHAGPERFARQRSDDLLLFKVYRYRIVERNACFARQGTGWLRHNEIWREIVLKGEGGAVVSTQFLYANRVRVMYEPGGAS